MEMEPQNQALAKKYRQIVAKAWSDHAFKQRLIANPAEVLRENGLDVPQGTEVRLVEGEAEAEISAGLMVLSLPPKPSSEELSDAQLERVSGGTVWAYIKKITSKTTKTKGERSKQKALIFQLRRGHGLGDGRAASRAGTLICLPCA